MILQLNEVAVTVGSVRVLGMVALAGGIAIVSAIAYRWYANERIQEGLAVLVGLAVVAIYLNTTTAIGQAIGGGTGLFDLNAALTTVVTFLLAGGGALVGRQIGDHLAVEAAVVTGRRELEADVSRIVSAVGRVVSVTLPEEIDDMEGYDPVPKETKAALAGTTLLFPRRLTVAELRNRLRDRLADDYGIGHVDIELTDDASVEYLAVGQRAAGLGPTLAPGTAAVALRADPAFAASSGDVVELWHGGAEPAQVATGELRAATDDIVTIALDEDEARSLPAAEQFRLVTRPATPRADREFAGVLRAADERMGAITVDDGSDLVGKALSTAAVAVVAIRPASGSLVAVPSRDRPFEGGDIVYAVGRPDALRRLEAAATAPEPEPSS